MPTNRRGFLARLGAAGAALAALPDRVLAQASGGSPPALPRASSGLPQVPAGELPSEFWRELRKEFLIPEEEAFFNTGTLGSSPRVVLDAVVRHMTHVDKDIAHWDYKEGNENYFTGYYPEDWLRGKVAALLGCDGDEIALTQNATFGMNFLANGLELSPSDEVVVMEGAHVGGRSAWELKDHRYGPTVKYVRVPVPPESPEQLIDLYEAATSSRTRVWAIPHLTSGTAILFPVREMCRRARDRDILSVVDGAQTFGHLAIDVRAMGCDAFFTSPHKWMLAPKGTGVLYVRRELLKGLWPTLASGNFDNYRDGGFRLMQYGTGNLSLLVGLERALDFHAQIGSSRVEARIVGLANGLRAGLTEIPGTRINSPVHPALRSATTVWALEGVTGGELMDELWSRARVRVRAMGGDDMGVRQCCHIYNLEEEVARTLETVRAIARA